MKWVWSARFDLEDAWGGLEDAQSSLSLGSWQTWGQLKSKQPDEWPQKSLVASDDLVCTSPIPAEEYLSPGGSNCGNELTVVCMMDSRVRHWKV